MPGDFKKNNMGGLEKSTPPVATKFKRLVQPIIDQAQQGFDLFISFAQGIEVHLGVTVYDFLQSYGRATFDDGVEVTGGVTTDTLAADSAVLRIATLNVANGTPPLTITSTTKVNNLNVDQVDGQHLNQGVQTSDSPSFVQVHSTVATGTAPLVVASTTEVANLKAAQAGNADTVDNIHGTDLAPLDSPVFTTPSIGVANGTSLDLSGNTITMGNGTVATGEGVQFDIGAYTLETPVVPDGNIYLILNGSKYKIPAASI